MNCLLDTHTFLLFLEGNVNLSVKARKTIENPNNTNYISIASIWEVAIKMSLEKLKLDIKLEELKAFLDYMSDEGYRNDSDPEINHQTHLAFKELVQRFKSVIFDVFKVNL